MAIHRLKTIQIRWLEVQGYALCPSANLTLHHGVQNCTIPLL